MVAAERVFEPLFTTKPYGTGLGLAIVKHIVNRHRGGLLVESQAGRGTAFAATARTVKTVAILRRRDVEHRAHPDPDDARRRALADLDRQIAAHGTANDI